MSQAFREQQQGYEVYGLRSAAVEVRVIPALGAKVSSLISRRTGREWMWSPPGGASLHRNRTGDPFPESTLLGGDECIPTLAPCRWRGRDLPDHGEVWTESWDAQIEAGAVVTRLRLPISPLTLERRVTLRDNRVQFDYTLVNLLPALYEYVWAFHPLLTIADGDAFDVPCTQVRADLAFGGARSGWPHAVNHGDAIKLYTEDLTDGYAAIRNERRGEALVFEFDRRELPIVGLWINRGGWNGFQHVAIEPTSGAPDALTAAVQDWQRFASVPGGGTRRWSFTINCQ